MLEQLRTVLSKGAAKVNPLQTQKEKCTGHRDKHLKRVHT